MWMLGLMAATGGCARQGSPDSPEPGELVAIWEGREPGRMRVGAEALLCSRDSVVEVFGFFNDRAVGLAFYLASDSLVPGEVPVAPPGEGAPTRPSVAGVFRAMERDALAGYQAREGQVEIVHVGGGTVTGRYAFMMMEHTTMAQLQVRGAFRELPLRPAPEPCGRRRPAAGASGG